MELIAVFVVLIFGAICKAVIDSRGNKAVDRVVKNLTTIGRRSSSARDPKSGFWRNKGGLS